MLFLRQKRIVIMKSIVLALLLFVSMFWRTPTQAEDENGTKVKALFEHTLKNMVFVEGGAFMMGASEEEMIAALGDKAFYYYLPCRDNRPAHEVVLNDYYLTEL